MAKYLDKRIVLKNVRVSYVFIFAPKQDLSGKEKYSVQLIISKDDPQVKKYSSAIKEVATDRFPKENIKKLFLPLRDGDEEYEDAPDSIYKGCYFFNASTNTLPYIRGHRKGVQLTEGDEEAPYSGCYANVQVKLASFDSAGNKGVTAYLEAIQKCGDGERLAGGGEPEFEYSEEDDEDDILL